MLHMQNVIVSFTLAVVFVLLGSVATELRWGGRHNFTFTRHEFLVVTVKEWLKLVYFYQSYRKNKSGVPLILDHPVCINRSTSQRWCYKSTVSRSALTVDTVYISMYMQIDEYQHFSANVSYPGRSQFMSFLKFVTDVQRAPLSKSHLGTVDTDYAYKSTYLIWLIHISRLCYLIAEQLKLLPSFFVPVYGWKYDCSDQKIEIPKLRISFSAEK